MKLLIFESTTESRLYRIVDKMDRASIPEISKYSHGKHWIARAIS